MKQHTISFKHAWDGLVLAFKEQPNLRVHFLSAFMVLILGLIVGLAQMEWVLLIFTMSLVLIAEMVNTTIEAVTDLLTDKWHLQAKNAKDIGAGMVLVAAVSAVVVGCLVFGPYLIKLAR